MGIAYNTSIVRDGLVLHLDAANVKSYPGSGTTMQDLSKNTANSTLISGTSISNGVFLFDGTDDGIDVPSRTLTSWTIGYWFYHDTEDGADMSIGQKGFNQNRFYHRDTGTSNYRLRVHNNEAESITDLIIGDGGWQNWHQLFYGMDGNGSVKGWIDGELKKDVVVVDSSEFIVDSIGLAYTGTSFAWNGSLNNIMVYDRQLTDSEIKQNFEALRGRYGI